MMQGAVQVAELHDHTGWDGKQNIPTLTLLLMWPLVKENQQMRKRLLSSTSRTFARKLPQKSQILPMPAYC